MHDLACLFDADAVLVPEFCCLYTPGSSHKQPRQTVQAGAPLASATD
jgi:hypothetical protein